VRVITRGRVRTRVRAPSTVRMVVRATPRATTHEPEPIRVEPRPGDLAARAEWQKHGIHAPGRTHKRARDEMSTAAGARPECSAAINGRRPRERPTARRVRRRASRRGAAAGRRSADAALTGEPPLAGAIAGTCMPATTATCIATRVAHGRSTTTEAGTASTVQWGRQASSAPVTVRRNLGLSSSTADQLNRDLAARSDGAQRTRDLGSVKSSGGSTRTWSGAGSYRPRSGGFGGGGGGFRGGGMRGGGRR
jgi:hypothetical protein